MTTGAGDGTTYRFGAAMFIPRSLPVTSQARAPGCHGWLRHPSATRDANTRLANRGQGRARGVVRTAAPRRRHAHHRAVPMACWFAGAMKRIQGRASERAGRPPAEGVFALLRADVDFSRSCQPRQAAAEQGVTPNALNGREATWESARLTTLGRASRPPGPAAPNRPKRPQGAAVHRMDAPQTPRRLMTRASVRFGVETRGLGRDDLPLAVLVVVE